MSSIHKSAVSVVRPEPGVTPEPLPADTESLRLKRLTMSPVAFLHLIRNGDKTILESGIGYYTQLRGIYYDPQYGNYSLLLYDPDFEIVYDGDAIPEMPSFTIRVPA